MENSSNALDILLLAINFANIKSAEKWAILPALQGQEQDKSILLELGRRLPVECWKKAEDELVKAGMLGVKIVNISSSLYPNKLRQSDDPPFVLYQRGVLTDDYTVGIVGSRGASAYGLRVAAEFACDLASSGVQVISGLALGVDTAAHKGAINARKSSQFKGAGVGVIGSGFLRFFPPENAFLAEELVNYGGAVLSECALDAHASKLTFPKRNRIIAAISDSLIVVEAAERSGALITARLAGEYGKDVYAVPGDIYRPQTKGTHKLISDGAAIITSSADILNKLSKIKFSNSTHEKSKGNTLEEKIISILKVETSLHVDQLADEVSSPINLLNAKLAEMEMRGLISSLPGGFFALGV